MVGLVVVAASGARGQPSEPDRGATRASMSMLVGASPVERVLLRNVRAADTIDSKVWVDRRDPFCELADAGWRCYRKGVIVRLTGPDRGRGDVAVRAVRLWDTPARVTVRLYRR